MEKGFHLTLDGYGCPARRLECMDTVYQFLDKGPLLIAMTKLIPPYVVRFKPSPGHPGCGLTGFVIVAESHLAVHTTPEHGYVAIDVYSCKHFDNLTITNYAIEMFDIQKAAVQFVERGMVGYGGAVVTGVGERVSQIHP